MSDVIKCTQRGKKTVIVCANPGCNQKKEVRVADLKRGWGLYCSRTCKAKHQEMKTKQFSRFLKKNKKAIELTLIYTSKG